MTVYFTHQQADDLVVVEEFVGQLAQCTEPVPREYEHQVRHAPEPVRTWGV